MNEWLLLISVTLVGSLFSLVGGVMLLTKRVSVRKVQLLAVPFAAGALLAAAFLDLLPEALEHGGEPTEVAALILVGFIFFFVLERFLGWFHHHHQHDDSHQHGRQRTTIPLIVIGDIIHNALDGLVIGAAFLADPLVGVVTTIAIAAHEIPQEIGDFGLLLARGMSRKRVLLVNVLSAIVTVVAAAFVFGLGSSLGGLEPILLSIAAGMFVYVAASDLIPTIHEEPSVRVANYQTMILLVGIVFVGFTTAIAHDFIDAQGASHTHNESGHEH